jgi:hypothetical protein
MLARLQEGGVRYDPEAKERKETVKIKRGREDCGACQGAGARAEGYESLLLQEPALLSALCGGQRSRPAVQAVSRQIGLTYTQYIAMMVLWNLAP